MCQANIGKNLFDKFCDIVFSLRGGDGSAPNHRLCDLFYLGIMPLAP